MEQEKRLHLYKLEAVKAFARANAIDKLVFDPPKARIGIMTTGKAYLDTRQALEDLGITEDKALQLGIRLYKVGMTWPIEPVRAREFAEGLEEVIVIEEKREILEDQLVKLLYNTPAERRPKIIGKYDETGRRIQPTEGELSPTGVARVIAERLKQRGEGAGNDPLARIEAGDAGAPPRQCALFRRQSSTSPVPGAPWPASLPWMLMPHRRTSHHPHGRRRCRGSPSEAVYVREAHLHPSDGTYHSGLMHGATRLLA